MRHFFASLFALALSLAATAARADIVVGVAGPMTGSNAAFGEQFRRGAERAIGDLNAKGGVLGQRLRLVVGDDACDPKQAVSVANDMASRGAVFVAGHYCSSSSIPASDVYAESGIIQISPASTASELTERKLGNVFRVCGRNDKQGPLAADYVADHFKAKRIAVVDDKSTFGKGVADEFRRALNAKGVKEQLDDSIIAGERDYSSLVTKLKQARVDVLYFGGYHPEAGQIVRQMRAQNVTTVLIGADSLVTDEFWSITGPAGEGTLLTFGPDPRLNPANAGLVQAFRAARYEPEAYTLYTYAAVQAWAAAADKAGSTDAATVSAALKANSFDTAMGKIGFDAKGDVTAPGYVLYVWRNGKYVYAQ
jgi:branched-chain amino acid transport system substrate-binding protein